MVVRTDEWVECSRALDLVVVAPDNIFFAADVRVGEEGEKGIVGTAEAVTTNLLPGLRFLILLFPDRFQVPAR